jgi:lantibiotic modifying enzyme
MPENDGRGGVAIAYQALGPDLYGGSAGVALFLAEVGTLTDDAEVRAAAVGALRHAASRVDSLPPSTRAGLYAGRYGITIALAYSSVLLDEPEFVDLASIVGRANGSEVAETFEYDVIAGHAGAIVGLLAVRRLVGDEALLERAIAHGDALVEAARPQEQGLAWHSPSVQSTQGLAGYSHGAAGVAASLLELEACTGAGRYRDTASGALAYERALFDPKVRNWPDLRETAAHSGEPRFATFWCHGAPGIALSRIRALELGAEAAVREEAIAALETTATWIETALATGMNYSLCHGLAGNAEILLEGSPLAGVHARALTARVAAEGISSYFSRGVRWPSGACGEPTPSLFLGDAGVGRFYLRLAAPELPSVLLIRPTEFSPEARVGGTALSS